MKKGATTDAVIKFTNAFGKPLNITGATIKFMVKASIDALDNDALADIAGTIIDGPNGLAKATISATIALTFPNNVVIEAMAIYGDGTVVRTDTMKEGFEEKCN